MTDKTPTARPCRPTRFARLWPGGEIQAMPAGMDFVAARAAMVNDDPDVEMLEVEVIVVRALGRPHVQLATSRHITCPTCGEEIYV